MPNLIIITSMYLDSTSTRNWDATDCTVVGTHTVLIEVISCTVYLQGTGAGGSDFVIDKLTRKCPF